MSREYIKDIDIRGFRNIRKAHLEFSDGINIVCGENGQGKTNLIEAVWLMSGGKSFRGSRDREMINFDSDEFRIEGNVTDGERNLNLVVACSKTNPKFSSRMARRNGAPFESASHIAGSFFCVIFAPVHLNIVSGGPALRRKFMDACLCQLSQPFMDAYRRYNSALATRNAFLKDINRYDRAQQEAIFTSLDSALASNGAEIFKSRRKFCEYVSAKARQYYENISGGREKLTVNYRYVSDNKDDMLDRLYNSRQRDMFTGTTSFGVHHDDIELLIDSRQAKDYASQGQQRSIVIALKLAESDFMEQWMEISPVILLDDVLSELDFQRQDYLINNIKDKQVFITTCETDRIKLSDSRKLYVDGGVITE